MKWVGIFLALIMCASSQNAYAQGAALVQKPITTGHCASWITPNLIQDSGFSCVNGAIVLGNPTGGSKGTGTLNAQGLYINGVAVSSSGAPSSGYFTGITFGSDFIPNYLTSSRTVDLALAAVSDGSFCHEIDFGTAGSPPVGVNDIEERFNIRSLCAPQGQSIINSFESITFPFATSFPTATGDAYVPGIGTKSGTTTAVVTGSIFNNVLTITAVTSGTVGVGNYLTDAFPHQVGSYIVSNGTGSGGTGTYNLSPAGNISSETITLTTPPSLELNIAVGGAVLVGANTVTSGPSSVEQTCTLVPKFGGTNATVPVQICSYTIFNHRVFLTFYLEMSATVGTGSLTLAGLPVVSSSNASNFGAIGPLLVSANGVSIPGTVMAQVGPSSTAASVIAQGATGPAALTQANFNCSGGSHCPLMGTLEYTE